MISSFPTDYQDKAKEFKTTAPLLRTNKTHITIIEVSETTLKIALKCHKKLNKEDKPLPFQVLKHLTHWLVA